VQARNLINVRTGPGIDYPVAGSLVFLEVRVIVGRAANAEWWVIEMPGSTEGWVANTTVNVHGYTGDIPIVEAPEIGGSTPTPGADWNPTPNPICPTHTPTPTARATGTATSEPTAPPTATTAEEEVQPTATAEEEASPTAGASPTLPVTGANPTPPVESVVEGAAEQGGNPNWVLLAGVGLVAVGGVAFVLFNRRS
jgi:hypothetical protein